MNNNRLHKKKLLVILLLTAAAVLLTAGSGYVYVGSNKFCGYTCHQMKTRAVIWERSSHNKIKCITCHSEPGLIGEFKAHVDGFNYLKSFIRGKTTHLTIFATRRNPARLKACIHCHPAETLKEETEAIRINHVSHIKEHEFLCTDCHEDMIHGSHSFEVELTLPREENCIACHLIKGARLNCQSCHIKNVTKRERQLFVMDALREGRLKPLEQ